MEMLSIATGSDTFITPVFPIDFLAQLCDETFTFTIRIRKLENEQTIAGHKSKETTSTEAIKGHR